VANELPSDGMDSIETVRVESTELVTLSQTDTSSASRSSGDIRRMSKGLLLSDRLNSFSDFWALSIIESTVIIFSVLVWRTLREALGGGMLVTANKAATEGGMESGECTSLGRRGFLASAAGARWG
jgi:hypothetical protein